jgi:hypothetical protein
MRGEPIETELALIRRDIQVISDVLYGNGNDRKGLIDQIETLAGAADRGRWSLKTMLWAKPFAEWDTTKDTRRGYRKAISWHALRRPQPNY